MLRPDRSGDLLDVPVIRSAAAAKDTEFRSQFRESGHRFSEFLGIARIWFGCLVEFGMTALGDIGADATEALKPIATIA